MIHLQHITGVASIRLGLWLSLLFCIWTTGKAQTQPLKGQILTSTGEAVFAANVWWQSAPQQGTLTDLDGYFQVNWEVSSPSDTLLIQYPGYQLLLVPKPESLPTNILLLTLIKKALELDEVEINANVPISGDFSVVKLDRLDIYLNPQAAADPLRALVSLAASTNTDESANPVLRASNAELSRVVVNGVPIYQPVRNGQINGTGNFSLFNTEIVEKQYVYPSNPPLTYGNTSAGLVEIETRERRASNSLQLSTSLASVGLMKGQSLGEKGSWMAYGNYQFSEAFVGLNRTTLPELRAFGSIDAGATLSLQLNKALSLKTLVYGIDESFEVQTSIYQHTGEAWGSKRRAFQATQLRYQLSSGYILAHLGYDQSEARYHFGNIRSLQQNQQTYAALSYKGFWEDALTWQVGINADVWRRRVEDTVAQYFFALHPEAPTLAFDTFFNRPLLESYGYLSFTPNDRWQFSAGIRPNIPLATQSFYLSHQLSAKYHQHRHQWLLSGGRYHSYGVPNFLRQDQGLIQADQLALDYQYDQGETLIRAAAFFKTERGPQSNGLLPYIAWAQARGIEFSIRQHIGQRLQLELANIWVQQRIRFSEQGSSFRGGQDLPYFLKGQVQWLPGANSSLSMSVLARPGTPFSPISSASFDPNTGTYQPIFEEVPHSDRLPVYLNASLAYTYRFRLRKMDVLAFVNVNNFPNRLNPRDRWYTLGYEAFSYAPYTLRTIYAGLIWQWTSPE